MQQLFSITSCSFVRRRLNYIHVATLMASIYTSFSNARIYGVGKWLCAPSALSRARNRPVRFYPGKAKVYTLQRCNIMCVDCPSFFFPRVVDVSVSRFHEKWMRVALSNGVFKFRLARGYGRVVGSIEWKSKKKCQCLRKLTNVYTFLVLIFTNREWGFRTVAALKRSSIISIITHCFLWFS